jgi:SAM-dependent methyltransferase
MWAWQSQSLVNPFLVRNLNIEQRVWHANIDVHEAEALAYDQVHLEIFDGIEQQRLVWNLKYAKELVRSRSDVAFDFGCGTGNVTSKLLMMGWKVVAGDVSENRLKALPRKLSLTICGGGRWFTPDGWMPYEVVGLVLLVFFQGELCLRKLKTLIRYGLH